MSFLVYYGHDSALLPRLRQASVLVLEPRGWTAEQLQQLRTGGGPRLLGYLSPFAWPDWAGPARFWWGPWQRDAQWSARWYSLRWTGWRRKVRQLADEVRCCCDGIFLDNLDRLEADPASLAFLCRWLDELRKVWPDVYLLGNRGFSHWNSLEPLLDGVMLENLTDQAFDSTDRQWVLERLESVSQAGLFALDYATRCVPSEAERLRALFPKMAYYRAPDQSLQSLPTEP